MHPFTAALLQHQAMLANDVHMDVDERATLRSAMGREEHQHLCGQWVEISSTLQGDDEGFVSVTRR